MKAVIIGAGVIGITTAYELSNAGFDVIVIDKLEGPAMDTSFANAGLIATGHAFAWGNPSIIKKIITPKSKAHSAFKLQWSWDLQFLKWGMKFIANCTSSRFYLNTLAKQTLCRYSHQLLEYILKKEKINCNYNNSGLLYLHRTKNSMREAESKLKSFPDLIPEYKILDSEELIHFDPFYAKSPVHYSGAIFCPGDASGDCYAFSRDLTIICRDKGVEFLFNTAVNNFLVENNRVKLIQTDQGDIEADIFIAACGSLSPLICKQIGISLPIYPVKGYSLTLPILKNELTPETSGIDEENFLAFCRIGSNIRITSRAEFMGYDKSIDPLVVTKLTYLTKQLFGNALDYDNSTPWTGLRPATPAGPPFISSTNLPNFFVNSGHGHLGWTMACGSARLLTDLITNNSPEISPDAYSIANS